MNPTTTAPVASRPLRKPGQSLTTFQMKINKENPELIGKYLRQAETELPDMRTGELKPVPVFYFETQDERRVKVVGNAGLKLALIDADIREGEIVLVKWLEKKDIGGGQTVNVYDVVYLGEFPKVEAAKAPAGKKSA